MRVNSSQYTIGELREQYRRKDLVINRKYQRGGGIWPISAQSYFIDTILEGYPFPKLYFYQIYDRARAKPVVEVVDGQQRLLTILNFMDGKVRLSNASARFAGNSFNDLSEEDQEKLQMYSVDVDVILAAERSELLEMFRRMNAYTAPLNAAEKRHSKFQGSFKWFAVELADRIGPVLEEFGILTPKQIIRMGDVDLISELVLVSEEGIVNRSEAAINRLYERYDDDFDEQDNYFNLISGFFEELAQHFSEFKETLLMKPYAVHSLFCAYLHIRRGFPGSEGVIGFPPRNREISHSENALQRLRALIDAHELKEVDGEYRDYVRAALSTTTKAAQRKDRARVLAEILDPQ